jgi:hypothetical protein
MQIVFFLCNNDSEKPPIILNLYKVEKRTRFYAMLLYISAR